MKKITFLVLGILFAMLIHANDTILPYPIDTVNGTAVYRYTPEKSIGLYRISIIFGLPMGEIVQWNPQLEQRGPQLTDVLLIPVKGTIRPQAAPAPPQPEVQTPVPAPAPVPQDTTPAEPAVETQETPQPIVPATPIVTQRDTIKTVYDIQEITGQPLRIAVMLPLRANAFERDGNDDRFFDFYAGMLLAIRNAEQMGQAFEIHTYDVERADNQLTQAVNDPFLQQANAIIGPVYTPQIETIAKAVTNPKCWILAPFSSHIPCIHEHPNILQFNPTQAMESAALTQYLETKKDSVHCFVLQVEGNSMQASVRELVQQLQDRQIPTSHVALHTILADSLPQILPTGKENVFIFHNDKINNLSIILPKLTAAADNKNLTLYSHYAWQKESINMPQLYATVFRHNDQDSTMLTPYQQAFDHYFGHPLASTHPRYDLLGYDLTTHLIHILQQTLDVEDPEHLQHIMNQSFNGIQTSIQYHRTDSVGGYINQHIEIIHP